MPRPYRKERISDLVVEELSKLILKNVEVPGALITIIDADVSENFENALVKVSAWPSEKTDAVLKELNRQRDRLQYMMVKQFRSRPIPQITFKMDMGLEKAAGVEKALLKSED